MHAMSHCKVQLMMLLAIARFVRCRFYDKAHKIDVLEMFKKLAVDADALPDIVFANIGRCVLQDLGFTAVAFRLLMKLIDYNLFATLISRAAPLMPDFQRHMKMVRKDA